jgi:hypothetical protein
VPTSIDRRYPVTWVFGPGWDLLISLSWLPIFLIVHTLAGDPGPSGTHVLQSGLSFAFLLSFMHQPLTFGLVYGDSSRFRLHWKLFLLGPLVAVAVGSVAAVKGWQVVIPVAAAWNLQHTIQQRYGIQRIYSGRSGYGSARLDRAVAYVPMAAVLALVAANPGTTALINRTNLDSMNAGAVHLLTSARPIAASLAALAGLATAVVLVGVVRQERDAGYRANPGKWVYQMSSLAMLGAIVIDPASGLIAYVCAHAVEYAVVVDRTAQRRYGRPEGASSRSTTSLLGHVAERPHGRLAFFGGIALAAALTHGFVAGTAYNAVLYSVGALHFTFDSVIWKLRQAPIARDFSITTAAVGLPAAG